jgi:sugar (pentulose or hexulose) kinase
MGGFTSGLVLDRWLRVLGLAAEDRDRLDAAALALPRADGIDVDEQAMERIAETGLPHGVTPAHVWRAVLESLAVRGRSVVTTIERVSGPSDGLVVTGGVARGAAFRAIKEHTVAPFVTAPVEEAGARGAALLGGCAAGVYRDAFAIPAPRRPGI